MFYLKIVTFLFCSLALPIGLAYTFYEGNSIGAIPMVIGFLAYMLGLWGFNTGWFTEIAKVKLVKVIFYVLFIPILKFIGGANWFLNALYALICIVVCVFGLFVLVRHFM